MRKLDRFRYVMGGELATTRLFYTLHRAIYRLSGGRIFSRMVGCPVVLLTTTGRKSGEPRTAPLFGFEEGQSIIVIPSNAGKKHYPSWYLNLRANPQAQVQVERELRQVSAREATPQEQERLWVYVTSLYAGYDAYRERTDRDISVVFLDRV